MRTPHHPDGRVGRAAERGVRGHAPESARIEIPELRPEVPEGVVQMWRRVGVSSQRIDVGVGSQIPSIR